MPTRKHPRPDTEKKMTKVIEKEIFKKEPDNKKLAKIWNNLALYGPVKTIFYDDKSVDIMNPELTV